MSETFWTLLRDPAHWEFEGFLMLVFDVLIAGIAWPFLRKHWQHHLDRDRREMAPQHPFWNDSASEMDSWTVALPASGQDDSSKTPS
jgi:hypothetical protein